MIETKVNYYGHSCFSIVKDGFTLLLDPYQDNSVPGLKLPDPLMANEVLCSHAHEDHNASDQITIEKGGKDPWEVSTLVVPHDEEEGAKRGMNNITILESEGIKLVHFGDCGRMLNVDEIQRIQNADVVMIPVGGYFTITAQQARAIIEKTTPKCAILMHYRTKDTGYGMLADLDEIAKTFPDMKKSEESSISLNPEPSILGNIVLKPIQ